jgi:hypothetical protein
VTEKQVREKMAYYANEFPGIDRLKSWFQEVWQAWDSDVERIEATYGTHPTAWKGSHTEPFTDRHPEEIEKLINGSSTVQDS